MANVKPNIEEIYAGKRVLRSLHLVPRHGADAEYGAALNGKYWRAYEVHHIFGYSHYHGGQTNHATAKLARDLEGNPIRATSFEELRTKLAAQPFVKPEFEQRSGHGQHT